MNITLTNTNKNLVANFLNQLLGIGFPVLIQTFTIRHYNISDLGYLNLLNSYWTIFSLGLSFFNFYLLKIFSVNKSEIELKLYLTNSIVLMYSFIILPYFLYLIFLYWKYPEILELTLVTSLPIITAPISFEIFFQASLKNSYILIRRFIVKLIFVILMFSFAKEKSDFIIYVYIFCISSTFENIFNLFYIGKYISYKFIKIKILKDIVKNSINYLPFNLTYNLMPSVSIIASSYFLAINEVSIYSVIIKIINLSTTFITSAVLVLYPVKLKSFINQKDNTFNDYDYIKKILIVSIIISFGLIFLHKFIFYSFLANYKINNMLFQFSILSTFIIFHSIYNYVTFNYYFIRDRIFYISSMNIFILIIYFIELILVKTNLINFNFALLYVIPYPIVLFIIYLDIKKFRKLNY